MPIPPRSTDELEPSDGLLAEAAAAGNAAALEALVRRHYDHIHRMAWRWLGRRDGAEDVAQGVCVRLAGAIRGFRAEADFRTWLYRVTYNAAIDHIRQRQRCEPVEPSNLMRLVEEAASDRPTPEDMLTGVELWAAVRALPEQQRDAVLLVYAEDLSHAEAAAIMGCSEKTVSWHLHTARKRLKAVLETAS